jgi:hypothetical protein
MKHQEEWQLLQVKYAELHANADKYGKIDLHKYLVCVNAMCNYNCPTCDSYLPVFKEALLVIESQTTEQGKFYGGNEVVERTIMNTLNVFTSLQIHLTKQHGFISSWKYRNIALLLSLIILIYCLFYGFWLRGMGIGFLLFCIGGYLDYRNIRDGKAVM